LVLNWDVKFRFCLLQSFKNGHSFGIGLSQLIILITLLR
jgi:hypothetical protein